MRAMNMSQEDIHHACDICEKLSDAMKNGRCIYYYIDLGSITMNHNYLHWTYLRIRISNSTTKSRMVNFWRWSTHSPGIVTYFRQLNLLSIQTEYSRTEPTSLTNTQYGEAFFSKISTSTNLTLSSRAAIIVLLSLQLHTSRYNGDGMLEGAFKLISLHTPFG